VYDLRPEMLRSLRDEIPELGLINVSGRNVHDPIIAPANGWSAPANPRESGLPTSHQPGAAP